MTACSFLAPDPVLFDAETVRIELSAHAVVRFQERVRPALSLRRAGEELRELILLGRITNTAPRWLAARQQQRSAFYLVIGDVVLPLEPSRRDRSILVALTCIAAGCLSDASRAMRNRRRAGDFARSHQAGRSRKPERNLPSP